MRSFLLAALITLLASVSVQATVIGEGTVLRAQNATAWTIDASHSAVNFRIRHFFTPVPGVFERWGGTINFDANNLAASSIDIAIEVASVNTKNTRRDEHLRNPDFFEAEKYPNMTFKSSSIRRTGENAFVAVGQLTIKETTQTIELPFEFLGSMPHPWRENTEVAGFKANYSLSRLAFGVGSGDFVQTTVVGDQVDIEIFLEVTRLM
jgi:polyisoprenoid-binding protein YceI